MKNKTAYMLLFLTVCCLALGGCTMFPNFREFHKGDLEKGSVELHAYITYKGKQEQVRYRYLRMGRFAKDSRWQVPLVLELPDKQRVALESITPQFLAANNAIFSPASPENNRHFDEYFLGGCTFSVREDRVVAIRFHFDKDRNHNIVLWDADMRKRYPFPLSQEDVIELFGEPDKQQDMSFL